jgi:hypothetical protein
VNCLMAGNAVSANKASFKTCEASQNQNPINDPAQDISSIPESCRDRDDCGDCANWEKCQAALPPTTPIYALERKWSAEGVLLRVTQGRDKKQIIAYFEEVGVRMPARRLPTKGGRVDLHDWVGQQIKIKNVKGKLCGFLVPLDEKQMRIYELEDCLAAVIRQMAPQADGQYCPGADSSISHACKVLGLPETFDEKELVQFCRYSSILIAREHAKAAVTRNGRKK